MLITMIVNRANSDADQPGADVGEGRGDVVERAGGVVGDVLELADEVVVLVEVAERVALLDGVVEVADVARRVRRRGRCRR